MSIFDTHCHYNLEPLQTNWQSHLKKAQKEGVSASMIVGTNAETSAVALQQAAQSSTLFASIGFHPGFFMDKSQSYPSDQADKDSLLEETLTLIDQELKKLITMTSTTPSAIGEIGLDYYRLRSKGRKREVVSHIQKEAFKMQLAFAEKNSLPVLLHIRDQETRTTNTAYEDALTLISESRPKKFVLHCASGPLEYIQAAIDMGAYVGFDGNITYTNASHLRDILSITPPERILVETDAPYLAPQEYRGQVCEPWMIRKTASYLETQCNVDISQVYENSFLFFDIDKNHIQ